MAKFNKLNKVSENISIYRYDNGWMIELTGRDEESDWNNDSTGRLIC